ncbi:hypothetical protein EV214_108108 [Marinisporobacter balticus]|uniref:Uncharacterized protein n=1 Tax=Marinisporobacter balticus TaxID=2018667 RepID=A0A4R2LB51_9FIRM|nr:hypothetical protein EV214_108108 [Marinisporobacter balticus]
MEWVKLEKNKYEDINENPIHGYNKKMCSWIGFFIYLEKYNFF